jgi:hypothetical protein
MKVVSAYLLVRHTVRAAKRRPDALAAQAVLGGKAAPSAADITAILGSGAQRSATQWWRGF